MANRENELRSHLQTLVSDIQKIPLRSIARSAAIDLTTQDIEGIIRPTFYANLELQRIRLTTQHELSADSNWHYQRVQTRKNNIFEFLKNADHALCHAIPNTSNLKVSSLARDTHNRGHRPLRVIIDRSSSSGNSEFVIKFADPRPYKLLHRICGLLAEDSNIPISMPAVRAACPKSTWYLIDFINADQASSNPDIGLFMKGVGALTAVAYALYMIDAHLENVLVWNGMPFIVDPECVLYLLDHWQPNDRMLSTGLLAYNIHFSSLRGGNVNMHQVRQNVDQDGILRFRSAAEGFNNLLKDSSGNKIDPQNYMDHVLEGFTIGYKFFQTNKSDLYREVDKLVEDDFRVRFLLRKTRHYTAVLEMLGLPSSYNNQKYQLDIQNRFRPSGSFIKIGAATFRREWNDLLAGDIPYFWTTAADSRLHHHNGTLRKRCFKIPIKAKLKSMFDMLSDDDHDIQKKLLKHFLSVPVESPQVLSGWDE